MKLKSLLASISCLSTLLTAAPSFAQLNELPLRTREALVASPVDINFYYRGNEQTAQQAIGDAQYQAVIRRNDLNTLYFDTYSGCPSGQLFVNSNSYYIDPSTNLFYGVEQRREDCSGEIKTWGYTSDALGHYDLDYDGSNLVTLTLDFTDPAITDLSFVYDWNHRNSN